MSVGKSPATAILGTPVAVVFFSIPVARPAREVPFNLVTVVEFVLLPVPSKLEPVAVTSPVRVPIVLPVARAVAVLAFQDKAPVNVVHPRFAVAELNVKLALVLWGRFPVAAVTKVGKQVVSLDSLATVVLRGVIAALPSKEVPPILRGVARVVAVVALPDNAPVKVVAARAFVLEL